MKYLYFCLLLAPMFFSCKSHKQLLVLEENGKKIIAPEVFIHDLSKKNTYKVEDWSFSRNSLAGDFSYDSKLERKPNYYKYQQAKSNRAEVHLYIKSNRSSFDTLQKFLSYQAIKAAHVFTGPRDYFFITRQIQKIANNPAKLIMDKDQAYFEVNNLEIGLEGLSGTMTQLPVPQNLAEKRKSGIVIDINRAKNKDLKLSSQTPVTIPLEQLSQLNVGVTDYKAQFYNYMLGSTLFTTVLIISISSNDPESSL